MANIPVEKSSGAAWLPWLLGLLALAAIGFVIFQAIDEPDDADLAGVETAAVDADDLDGDDLDGAAVDPAPMGTVDVGLDTVRTVASLDEAIAAARDGFADGPMTDLDGVVVRLDDVLVQSLAGDSTFYIGTDDDRTLVVLAGLGESETGPGDGSDGVFNVDAGETVSIDGMLRRFARGMPGTADLSDDDVAGVEVKQYVITVRDPSQFSIAR